MKGLIVFLAAAVCAVFAIPAATPENFLVGGAPAARGTTPFMVSLQWVMRADTRQHFCGGCILALRWVLTAANCVDDLPVVGQLEAVAGIYNLSDFSTAQIRPVASIFINDNYQNEVGPFDLALLFVEEQFNFGQWVAVIPLPSPDVIHQLHNATIMGWGDIAMEGPSVFPEVLYSTTTPLIDFETCNEAIGNGRTPLDNTMVCSGPLVAEGVGFCTGDSGSPLVQQDDTGFELVGIASWGFSPCGHAPSVYTRSSAHNNWIYEVIASIPHP